MIEANDAIWRAANESTIAASITKLEEAFPGFAIDPGLPASTEMVSLGTEAELAIDGAAGVLMAQCRNLIVTIVYSQSCGCENCARRLAVIRSIYRETAASLRNLQSIREMNTIVAVAADTNQHMEVIS